LFLSFVLVAGAIGDRIDTRGVGVALVAVGVAIATTDRGEELDANLGTRQADARHVGSSSAGNVAKAAPLAVVGARQVGESAAHRKGVGLTLADVVDVNLSRVGLALVAVGNTVATTNRCEDFDTGIGDGLADSGHVSGGSIRRVAEAAPLAIVTGKVGKATTDIGEAALVGVDAIGGGTAVAELIAPCTPALVGLRIFYTETSADRRTNLSRLTGRETDLVGVAGFEGAAVVVGVAVLIATAVGVGVGAEVIADTVAVPVEDLAEINVGVGFASLSAGVCLAEAVDIVGGGGTA
jgi:hypothetical protein